MEKQDLQNHQYSGRIHKLEMGDRTSSPVSVVPQRRLNVHQLFSASFIHRTISPEQSANHASVYRLTNRIPLFSVMWLLFWEALYLFNSRTKKKRQPPARNHLHTSHKSLSLHVWFLVSLDLKTRLWHFKNAEMRLLGRRGSLFVTVWGNNSSLPATVTFLRGRSSLCHSWIEYQGSPDTPDPHIPTLVYNSCYEIVIFQGNGRWCVYEHLTSVYAALFIHEESFYFGCLSAEFSTTSRDGWHAERSWREMQVKNGVNVAAEATFPFLWRCLQESFRLYKLARQETHVHCVC